MTWVPVMPTRRVLLAVTGVALVGACGSPTGKGKQGTSPAEPVPPGQPDPVRDRAIAAETALLAQYDAALALPSVTADSGLAAKLTAIRAEHAAHTAAIKQGYTPPSTPTPSAPPASSAATTPSAPSSATPPPATTDAKTAVAALAKTEQDTASARTADILAADGATAMLLASIAASESGHAALLLGGAA